jgi:hypothetical protein
MDTLRGMKSQKAFRARCEDAGALVDSSVNFFTDANSPDAFEDDGNLHIRRYGLRAVFDVSHGQLSTPTEQNERTRTVFAYLGMEIKKPARVLVEDPEEAEENGPAPCPRCGR